MSVKGLVGLAGAILTFTHEATFFSDVDGTVSSGQANRISEGFVDVSFGPATDLFPGGVDL